MTSIFYPSKYSAKYDFFHHVENAEKFANNEALKNPKYYICLPGMIQGLGLNKYKVLKASNQQLNKYLDYIHNSFKRLVTDATDSLAYENILIASYERQELPRFIKAVTKILETNPNIDQDPRTSLELFSSLQSLSKLNETVSKAGREHFNSTLNKKYKKFLKKTGQTKQSLPVALKAFELKISKMDDETLLATHALLNKQECELPNSHKFKILRATKKDTIENILDNNILPEKKRPTNEYKISFVENVEISTHAFSCSLREKGEGDDGCSINEILEEIKWPSVQTDKELEISDFEGRKALSNIARKTSLSFVYKLQELINEKGFKFRLDKTQEFFGLINLCEEILLNLIPKISTFPYCIEEDIMSDEFIHDYVDFKQKFNEAFINQLNQTYENEEELQETRKFWSRKSKIDEYKANLIFQGEFASCCVKPIIIEMLLHPSYLDDIFKEKVFALFVTNDDSEDETIHNES